MNAPEIFPSLSDLFGEVIHSYSRAEALEDGALIDAGPMAREAGFKVPVALTAAAWVEAVTWSQPGALQDETGRLWDVLWMGFLAVKVALVRKEDMSSLPFQVLVVPNKVGAIRPRKVTLQLSIHGGDDGEPVVTISLPGED